MPNGNVLLGEVWETNSPEGRTIRGIIADVSTTILTLVSFTGNRFRISPDRFAGTWRFVQAPPATALRCSRRGCTYAGILRFTRGSTAEWVCPRHLPVGVQAVLTTESIGQPAPTPTPTPPGPAPDVEVASIHCLNCSNPDPVEDHRASLPAAASLWTCTRCNERWCIISSSPDWGSAWEQAMFDTLQQVRVTLAIENYVIQEMTTTMATFRSFEREARVEFASQDVAYAGIRVGWSATFAMEHPANTLLRIRLRGGPHHRTELLPRGTALRAVVDGNVIGVVDRFEATTETPRDVAMITPYTPGRTNLGPISFERTFPPSSESEAAGFLNSMAPTPFVSKGSRWVNNSNGDIVEVAYLGRSTDGSEPVVHFKRISDTLESNQMMLLRDFETMHRVFAHDTTKRRERETVVEVLKDEEWEHVESGEVVRIDSVDTKRNLVIVMGGATTPTVSAKRRSVSMLDFVNAKWRRIVRKTAFARLMEDD